MPACRIKVCGVTTVADARMCVDAGVDAIGVNFASHSPRRVEMEVARTIAEAVCHYILVVGVVVDLDAAAMLELRERALLGCLQLHGDEPPESLTPLLPHAYKALRASEIARAREYGGEHLLVDGPAPGTGRAFDWLIASDLAKTRKLTIAGGLHAGNVAEAIRAVSPYCVDVATGVEAPNEPRRKDAARVRAFITTVRGC